MPTYHNTTRQRWSTDAYLQTIPLFRKCNTPAVIYSTIDRHLGSGARKFIHIAVVLHRKSGAIAAIATNDSYVCAERAALAKMRGRRTSRLLKKGCVNLLTWRVNHSGYVSQKAKPCMACSRAIRQCEFVRRVFYVNKGGWVSENARRIRNDAVVTAGRQNGPSYRMSPYHA